MKNKIWLKRELVWSPGNWWRWDSKQDASHPNVPNIVLTISETADGKWICSVSIDYPLVSLGAQSSFKATEKAARRECVQQLKLMEFQINQFFAELE